MLTIGIEAQRIFRTNKHGMDIVILETIKMLQEIDKTNHYYIFVRKGQDKCLKPTSNFEIIEINTGYVFFEQFYLPYAIKKYKLDLLHCTSNTAPIIASVPLVLTLHDVIFLEKFNLKGTVNQVFGNIYRRFIAPLAAKKSWKIITVSEYSKTRIVKYIPETKDKIDVVPNGVGSQFKIYKETADIRIKYTLPEKFIFYMGSKDPRKNLRNVLRAYKLLTKSNNSIKLVISNYNRNDLLNLLKIMNLTELQEQLISYDYIPAEDLPYFYNLAEIFLFPSLSEGFGIPVLEAMACGSPVITSNTTALPEVAGDAAKLIDPYSPAEIANEILDLLSDALKRSDMVAKGLERSSYFSWTNSAMKVLDLYKIKIEEYQTA